MKTRRRTSWVKVGPVTVLLLMAVAAGVADRRRTTPPPEAAEHQRVMAQRMATVPLVYKDWVGQDAEVPPAAVRMLNANAIVSRTYRRIASPEMAALLLVHVTDSRDTVGHYPPVCYVNQGWILNTAQPSEVLINGSAADSTVYTFASSSNEAGNVKVENLFVLADGSTCSTMEELERAAVGEGPKFYGVVQVQIVTSVDVPEERRREIVNTLLTACQSIFAVEQQSAAKL